MSNEDLDYGEVMDLWATKAEEQAVLSEDPKDAWIYVDNAVWWPNPLYCGPEVKHPEQP